MLLFLTCTIKIIKDCDSVADVRTGDTKTNSLLYANDMELISSLQHNLDQMSNTSGMWHEDKC